MVVTTETTSLATTTENTTEIPIDTTTQATTEVPIETTTTEATEEPTTDDPNNGEDLPETGTTGMPLERVAEYSALALIIGGAVMILKSKKKED
ncbi:MAG: LPXTG cell wall anchor domain-containing protein [Oscillospiraceae bacterium]|nr:LPXTG cell wall anchor domain-containing protein [Oscillospiraceae bacterium]